MMTAAMVSTQWIGLAVWCCAVAQVLVLSACLCEAGNNRDELYLSHIAATVHSMGYPSNVSVSATSGRLAVHAHVQCYHSVEWHGSLAAAFGGTPDSPYESVFELTVAGGLATTQACVHQPHAWAPLQAIMYSAAWNSLYTSTTAVARGHKLCLHQAVQFVAKDTTDARQQRIEVAITNFEAQVDN